MWPGLGGDRNWVPGGARGAVDYSGYGYATWLDVVARQAAHAWFMQDALGLADLDTPFPSQRRSSIDCGVFSYLCGLHCAGRMNIRRLGGGC